MRTLHQVEQGLHLCFCQLVVYTFGDQNQKLHNQLRVHVAWLEL